MTNSQWHFTCIKGIFHKLNLMLDSIRIYFRHFAHDRFRQYCEQVILLRIAKSWMKLNRSRYCEDNTKYIHNWTLSTILDICLPQTAERLLQKNRPRWRIWKLKLYYPVGNFELESGEAHARHNSVLYYTTMSLKSSCMSLICSYICANTLTLMSILGKCFQWKTLSSLYPRSFSGKFQETYVQLLIVFLWIKLESDSGEKCEAKVYPSGDKGP